MELQGKIKSIGDTKEFGNNGFQKRELVLTTEEQYPQHILLEFVQDKCALLDQFRLGQSVKIGINIRGREWTSPQGETKYFNTLQGWRIESIGMPDQHFEPATDLNEDEHDDLPY